MSEEVKISELPVADQANIDDLLEASQVEGSGYVSRHISLDQVSTVVAASDQVADVIDAAIGTIPPPTTAWVDITGKPATFPPTIPTGPAIATWPYLALTGGTLTGGLTGTTAVFSGSVTTTGGSLVSQGGNLTIDRVGDAFGANAFFSSDAGQNAGVFYRTTATLNRWSIIKTTTAEGGSNAGSNFQINAYDDAGTILSTPIAITRSTGAVALAGALTGTTANFANTLQVGGGPLASAAKLQSKGADGDFLLGLRGATMGLRVTTNASGTTIAAVDETLVTSFQTLALTGAAVTVTAPLSVTGALTGTGATFSGTVSAPGAQIQMVFVETGAVATGTTVIPADDTIPQITEGNEYMTLAITPKSATSKLVIEVVVYGSISIVGDITVALFQDATANALAAVGVFNNTASGRNLVSFRHTMTSGTTSATTFRVRAGPSGAGTTTFNGAVGARIYGGVAASSIVIREMA